MSRDFLLEHFGTKAMIARFCEETGFSRAQISGPQRRQPLVEARHELFRRLYATGRLSLSQIGRMFDKHHSTVLHGIRQAEERMSPQGKR